MSAGRQYAKIPVVPTIGENMAENDPYDDGLNIHDLIKEAEESGSFNDYLERVGRKDWQSQTSPAPDAAAGSSQNTDAQGGTGQSSSTSVLPAIEPRVDQRTELEKYPGLAKSASEMQPVIAPTPVVTDFPAEPVAIIQPALPEYTEKTEVHNHPIVGAYTSTVQVAVERTDELDKIFINSLNKGVTEMTWEQVQAMIHQLRDQIVKTKRAEQGLSAALEHHIGKMNLVEKGLVAEKDRSYRSPRKAKTEDGGDKKASVPRTSKPQSGKKPSNQDEKTAQTLAISMGMTEEEVTEQMEKRGKLNDAMKGYIKRLFAAV